MKSIEFSNCLKQCSDVLQAAQAPAPARELRQLAMVFSTAGTKKVADVTAKLGRLVVRAESSGQSTLGPLCPVIRALTELVVSISPKAASDFALVSELLEHHANDPVDAWCNLAIETLATPPTRKSSSTPKKVAAPTNDQLVDRYERILESALGDDLGFRQAYARLESDPEMRAPEMSVLAKRFAAASAKARPAALKKIFARHQALMISRAASAATAGRVAG